MKQIAGHVSQISLECLKAQSRRAVSAAQKTQASCSSCSVLLTHQREASRVFFGDWPNRPESTLCLWNDHCRHRLVPYVVDFSTASLFCGSKYPVSLYLNDSTEAAKCGKCWFQMPREFQRPCCGVEKLSWKRQTRKTDWRWGYKISLCIQEVMAPVCTALWPWCRTWAFYHVICARKKEPLLTLEDQEDRAPPPHTSQRAWYLFFISSFEQLESCWWGHSLEARCTPAVHQASRFCIYSSFNFQKLYKIEEISPLGSPGNWGSEGQHCPPTPVSGCWGSKFKGPVPSIEKCPLSLKPFKSVISRVELQLSGWACA